MTAGSGLFLLLAFAASALAVYAFLAARSAKQAVAAREAELTQLRTEAESARGAEKAAKADAKEKREQARGLESELAAAKRRAFEQLEAAKRAGGAASLREEIEKLSHRLSEAREEATRAQERAKAAEAQVARAQAEARALAERKPEPAPAPAPAPVAVPAPAPHADDAPLAEARAQLAVEKDRADKAEARSTELRKKLSEVEKELRGARGRLETEKRIYVVQKGELELANDRYAELRRRYDALKKDHDDLIEAVREAAREEARQQQGGSKPTTAA